MNPNVMAPTAPRKLMQDVMPPYASAMPSQPAPVEQAVAQNTPAPVDPLASAPATQQAPAAQPAEIPVAQPASESIQPMFPVQTETQTTAFEPPAPAEPATPPAQPPQQAPAPEMPQVPEAMAIPAHPAMPARKANWGVVVFAVLVAVGLLAAAMIAFKSSN